MSEPVAAPAAPKSLVRKLAEVMAAVARVPKRGRNTFHGYDYATEADIAAEIRKELAARNVMLIPGIESMQREPVGEKGQVLTTLVMSFTFLDGETGEELKRPWMGAGTDKEDKGLYKATTGGEKYFLLKTFLVPTGDDPEKDDQKTGDREKPQPRGRQTTAGPVIGVPADQIGNPDRRTEPTTDAEVAQAFPPGIEGELPPSEKVIADFNAGSRECPACKKPTLRKGAKMYGGGVFCGECKAKWREPKAQTTAQGHVPDLAPGSVSSGGVERTDDPSARQALLTRARKLADKAGLSDRDRASSWTTYCGDADPKEAKVEDIQQMISWLETRAAARATKETA